MLLAVERGVPFVHRRFRWRVCRWLNRDTCCINILADFASSDCVCLVLFRHAYWHDDDSPIYLWIIVTAEWMHVIWHYIVILLAAISYYARTSRAASQFAFAWRQLLHLRTYSYIPNITIYVEVKYALHFKIHYVQYQLITTQVVDWKRLPFSNVHRTNIRTYM